MNGDEGDEKDETWVMYDHLVERAVYRWGRFAKASGSCRLG